MTAEFPTSDTHDNVESAVEAAAGRAGGVGPIIRDRIRELPPSARRGFAR